MSILFVELRMCRTFLLLVILDSSTVTIFALFLEHNHKSVVTCYDPTDKSWGLVGLLSWLKTCVYTPSTFDHLSGVGEQTSRQCGTCSNFLLRSPGKPHNWSQRCMWAHGLFDDGLRGWVLKFFQHCYRFSGAWSPWTFVILTDTRPALKHECHSKTAVWLKECSLKASWSISRVSATNLPSYAQNLMQARCSILPYIADKTKHEVEKALL
jgi:hypothetical protein